MQIRTHVNADKRPEHSAVVMPFYKAKGPQPAVEYPERLLAHAHAPIAASDFTAKNGEVTWLWANEPEKRIVLLGLGDKETQNSETLRRAFASLCRSCIEKKIASFSLFLPLYDEPVSDAFTKASLEGLYFESYSFDRHKDQEKKSCKIEEVTLITPKHHKTSELVEDVHKIMQAVFFARDLVNENADIVTPDYLAECAKEIAQNAARITTHVYDKKWIENQKMGLFLAVSKGASSEPRFIHMQYKGNPTSNDHTVLVGKGITFDTGGLNIKSSGFIENQRKDMAGAAACMATLQAVSALELACNVSVVIPTCENAIGSKSFKPGDVQRSYSGKTVEVGNTDAEGRLILADALSYAVKNLNPSRIIDVATLTGSIVVALGSEAIGCFSNSDALSEELFHCGQKTHERIWRMPLYEEYQELLQSDVADIKNVGASRDAGATLAALFLQEFVKSDDSSEIPWLHLDIAGCAYNKERRRYWQKLATGQPVRLLVSYLEHLAKKGR